MKLLHVDTNTGSLTPVSSEYQMRGVMDAFGIAQNMGDGKYIADFLDGTYLQFSITDGQAPQGGNFLPDVQYGNPYRDTEDGERFSSGAASTFPSLVDNEVGKPHDDGGRTFDDYVPASDRGVDA